MDCPDPRHLVEVDPSVSPLGITIAAATYCLTTNMVSGGEDPFSLEVKRLIEELKNKYTLETLKDDPVVKAYRKFYWRIGIDPTKTRPSSEALVRRALRGRFPRINPIVNAGNIASARHMVPIGLYDIDKFTPPARLTLSRGGEKFHAIGGKDEVLPPNIPILVDAKGVVMHLYPHRDSRLTMITENTTKLLAIAAGVPGVPIKRLTDSLRELEKLLSVIGFKIKEIIII
ncbi:MAG: hypothetical protein F7C35_07165 [Desulfurococcales archaeon]|nr:hypothetical protein [Desulfurococcales archaeon]